MSELWLPGSLTRGAEVRCQDSSGLQQCGSPVVVRFPGFNDFMALPFATLLVKASMETGASDAFLHAV